MSNVDRMLELIEANYETFAEEGGVPVLLVGKWCGLQGFYTKPYHLKSGIKALIARNKIKMVGEKVILL